MANSRRSSPRTPRVAAPVRGLGSGRAGATDYEIDVKLNDADTIKTSGLWTFSNASGQMAPVLEYSSEETAFAYFELYGQPPPNCFARLEVAKTLDGEAIATCSLFLGAGVAGIYDVGTVPERRQRGIGAAITRAAVAEAASCGYRMAILHATALGTNMYRGVGFQAVCPIGQYVWAPEDFRR